MKGVTDGAVPLEGDVSQADNTSDSSAQSPLKEQGEEPEASEGMQTFCVYLYVS